MNRPNRPTRWHSLALAVLALAGLGLDTTAHAQSLAAIPPKNTGTLTVGGKTFKLASALAYENVVFRRKETVVILSEKPLNLEKLKQSLKKNGNDDDFFPFETHIKLTFDGREQGTLAAVAVQSGGGTIIRSGDPNIQGSATFTAGTAQGSAGTKRPDDIRGMPFGFEVAFEVAVIPVSATPEQKPPAASKAKPAAATAKLKTQSAADPLRPPALLLEKDLRFEGSLADGSPMIQGRPARIHEVRLAPGKSYLIDMESKDFDAYLRILDSSGKQLAKDDDGGDDLNARIVFTPTREDTYRVVATRFGNRQGNYVLTIRLVGSNGR